MQKRIASLLGALIFVTIGFVAGTLVLDGFATEQTVTLEQVRIPEVDQHVLTEDEVIISDIYNNVADSVVAISVATVEGQGGSGSGFVIDEQGHIITNFHVVAPATNGGEVVINFLDGTITRAEIVGTDPDSDIAVLRVDIAEDRLFPVEFSDSTDLVIGQGVVALGSPFGQRWTLTSGVVSALDRSIISPGQYSIGAAIQTDAPINPGNSGGPLFNLSGQVVGVNSQIISETGASAGIGFAVPSNLAYRVSQELIETGDVQYSVIGISAYPDDPRSPGDVTLNVIENLGLENNQRGVIVGTVSPGGPADGAGLREAQVEGNDLVSADIITAIDGNTITGFNSLIAYLAQFTRPNDTVDLTVLRNGEEITVPLTLGERDSL